MNKTIIRNILAAFTAFVLCIVVFTSVIAQTNITSAEYFIDTDPGFGQAIVINVSPNVNISNKEVPVSLTGIADGFHNLFLRSKDANGRWSVTNKLSFYKTNVSTVLLPAVSKAEYFIDIDPGFGNATDIPISSATNITDKNVTVPLGGIPAGFHNLYIRTKDANGNWSISNKQAFFKTNASLNALPNIVKTEYFIDIDPGFGSATNIPITSSTNIADKSTIISLNNIADGFHNLYIRSKDANGNWSVSNKMAFYKTNANTTTLTNITKAEYFIDTDPGFGNATDIPVSILTNIVDKSISINLTGITEGFHNLFIRSRDENKQWSISNKQAFFKTGDALASLSNLAKAEYFIDNDPGFGKGINIPVNAAANIADQLVAIDLTNVSLGNHQFYLRSIDASGKWSITNVQFFNKPTPTDLIITLTTIAESACAGSPVQVPFTINAPYGSNNIYTAQLSNAAGNFANAVSIGTLAGAAAGSIATIIPASTAAGDNYRIRIVSSSPSDTSNTSTALVIKRVPDVAYNISGDAFTCTGSKSYSINNPQAAVTYSWQISSGGNIDPVTGTSTTINWLTEGKHTITTTASNGCGNAQPKALDIQVFKQVPALLPSITINGRLLTAATAGVNDGVTGFQWYKDGIIIIGQTNQQYTVPNSENGLFTAAYSNNCGTGNKSAGIVVGIAKTNQSIVFDAIPAKTFGDGPFIVKAIASSGLPVLYQLVSGPANLFNDQITVIGAGTIIVKAIQEGNNVFNAAEAFKEIIINKAAASIALSALNYVYDGNAKKATATTNPLGLNNSINYNGSDNLPVNAGNYAVVATITSGNYQGSSNGNLIISKAAQSVTIQNISDKSFNDAPFNVTAVASSALPVTFSLVTAPATGVASINGSTISLLGNGGTVTVTANQAGNINYNAAAAVQITFTVNPPLAKDLQVVTLLSPVSGCGLGNTADVTARIKNAGTTAVNGVNISYQVDGSTAVTEPVAATISAGAELNFTFAAKASFATAGKIYSVKVFTTLPGDERSDNDTLSTLITKPAVSPTGVSKDTTICAGTEASLIAYGGSAYQWTNGPSVAAFKVSPTTTTTYEVTVTDITGCNILKYNVKVNVNPSPLANAGTDQVMLKGSSINLAATGGGTYTWSNGDTTSTTVVSPSVTTNYSVTVANALGCKNSDEVKVTVNFSALNVSPGLYNFGSVVFDSSTFTNIIITNTGTLTETINSITGLTAPFTTNFVLPVQLSAGSSIQIPIRFKPDATLFYQNKFALATSAGTFNITLQGKGVVPAPAWTITPANYNFGNVPVGSTAMRSFTIINKGNIPVTFTTVTSTSVRFSGIINGEKKIPVGGSATLQASFNPVAISTSTATITIRTTTTGLSPLKTLVAGNGYVDGAAPQLTFLSKDPYSNTSGVSPAVGQPGLFTYSIIYKSIDGIAPMSGFPQVGIDKNGDKDFIDEGEGIFTLTKEGDGTNWINGEVFSYNTELPVSVFYGYQFFATDSLGNPIETNTYVKGPVVTREILDLHIFADDITFSKPNPAVNEDFSVNATIHNNSPYAATEIPIRFYYKDSIYLFSDTIPFIDGNSSVSITRTLNFSPDGFYPIKVWIDSSNTLGEGNLLNNYASRPVIVGNFTVPGTIDIVSTATPDGCTKGKIIFSGKASYRGLNLAGTPPVEGATVTITIPGYEQGRIITTHTNINGEWYVYDNPCAQDINPQDCSGYLCGVKYDYTVTVTDYTLTSPQFKSSVTRPCTPCVRIAQIQHGAGVNNCVLDRQAFTYDIGIANFEIDQTTGQPICAPTVYNDTINVYLDGVFKYQHTLDSIVACGSASYNNAIEGLTVGEHVLSYTHSYYNKLQQRFEADIVTPFTVKPLLADLYIENIQKNGPRSFRFIDKNESCYPAGPHKIYLYDSLSGYTEKVLIDSFFVNSIPANSAVGLVYTNPDWQVGCHFVTLFTDAGKIVAETNENNNQSSEQVCIEALLPDIEISNIVVSNSGPVAGGKVNFTATIKNIGESSIVTPFKISFKVDGIALGVKINVAALALNETSIILSDVYTIPANPCPVLVTVLADADENIIEKEEIKNNRDTLNFGVNLKAGRSCDEDDNLGSGFYNPDDPSSLCIPYTAPKNVTVYLATTVRNAGSRDAKNIKVSFRWKGEIIGTDNIASLKAGEKTESGFLYAFDTVGRFIVTATADYPKEICETDEKDNIGYIHIDVTRVAADLQILSQHIAPSNLNPNPGQVITIASSILNVGDGPSTPCKIRFYVNDVQLGDDITIDSIYAGQDTTVQATLPYSSDIVGPKILKVRADIENSVLERIKGNNEATRAIIVGDAPDFSRSIIEAITVKPSGFMINDSITISNYLRNFGGAAGNAWLKFSVRNESGELKVLDSVLFHLESNDSARVSLKWKVTEFASVIITEIAHAFPPEFNVENNIDSLFIKPILPLTLVSFNGKWQGNNVVINWKTTSEINVSHFELERSYDGTLYNMICRTNANNTGGINNYSFTDFAPATSKNNHLYYRLKMTDKDGQSSYSKIVSLSVIANALINIYPNPVKDDLIVAISNLQKAAYVFKLVDATGRECREIKKDFAEGKSSLSIDMNNLAPGVYLLKVIKANGETLEIKKVVKE
ncbi:MAG: CARDB domain-containing protein [Bacteroidota bacterium]